MVAEAKRFDKENKFVKKRLKKRFSNKKEKLKKNIFSCLLNK